MLLVPSVSQREAQRIVDLRQQGMTYKQIGRAMKRSHGQIARYDRLVEKYGIGAFAK